MNKMQNILNTNNKLLNNEVEGMDVLCGDFEGQIVMQRYRIGGFIDKGKFGRVYSVTDTTKARA